MVLGIVPAGGKAERFGGYPKDMLPIGENELLIDRTITALNFGSASKIMILSSKEKIAAHANRLGAGFDYRIKRSDNLWDALTDSFSYRAAWNLFAMPDTYYPQDIFDRPEMHSRDFNIGWFETARPSRFGVIQGDQIVDKQSLPIGRYQAWGVLCWSNNVIEFWLNNLDKIKTHTDAFNLAMDQFGFSLCQMEYYQDMARWDDYKLLVTGQEW